MSIQQLVETNLNNLTTPAKFLQAQKLESLPTPKQLLLTPIVYSSQDFEYLRKVYRNSVQRVGFFYTPPAFRYSFAGKVKSYAFFVVSAYHLKEWGDMLFANHQIKLDYSMISPHPKLYEFADKSIKFFKKPSCFS